MMKCPHSDCKKDFNIDWWFKKLFIPDEYFIEIVNFKNDLSIASQPKFNLFEYSNNVWKVSSIDIREPKNLDKNDKLKIHVYKCEHCYKYFYKIFSINFDDSGDIFEEKLIFEFPTTKIKFKSKKIPSEILNCFDEAQRCRSIWWLIWTWACLRKTVYILCDLNWVIWKDYAEKIENLPINNEDYKDFLTHIKWLWDDLLHIVWNEKYWKWEIDLTLELLPHIIEDIYKKEDDTIKEANKLLQIIRSKQE